MAFGTEIYNLLPNEAYEVVHALEVLVGLYIASQAFGMQRSKLGIAFVLYAITGFVHLLTHIGVFTLPFSHLVSRVLLLIAVIIAYLDLKK